MIRAAPNKGRPCNFYYEQPTIQKWQERQVEQS